MRDEDKLRIFALLAVLAVWVLPMLLILLTIYLITS
jgi:hypothetical protein